LEKQFANNNINFEILIGDDSPSETQITLPANTKYFHHKQNLGRAKNRNFLASKAKYKYLLFIDGDARVATGNFADNYINALKTNADVICGGTEYPKTLNDKTKKLHWKYGKNVESKSAETRSKTPYNSFTSFNFMVKKDVFTKSPFDERLNSYGHEDTLFGLYLKKHNIKISHINNQLIHTGLETNQNFIIKNLQAIRNLLFIQENIYPEIQNEVKLLLFHKKVTANIFMKVLLHLLSTHTFINIVKYFTVKYSNLKTFDLLKLLYLHNVMFTASPPLPNAKR